MYKLGLNFKCTARHTPEQNSIVERKFATLWVMMRAQIVGYGIGNDSTLKKLVWEECANMMSQVMNVIVSKATNKSSHEKV